MSQNPYVVHLWRVSIAHPSYMPSSDASCSSGRWQAQARVAATTQAQLTYGRSSEAQGYRRPWSFWPTGRNSGFFFASAPVSLKRTVWEPPTAIMFYWRMLCLVRDYYPNLLRGDCVNNNVPLSICNSLSLFIYLFSLFDLVVLLSDLITVGVLKVLLHISVVGEKLCFRCLLFCSLDLVCCLSLCMSKTAV